MSLITKTRTRSLERGDTVYQSFKDNPIKYILNLYKKQILFWYTRKLYGTISPLWNVISRLNYILLALLIKRISQLRSFLIYIESALYPQAYFS